MSRMARRRQSTIEGPEPASQQPAPAAHAHSAASAAPSVFSSSPRTFAAIHELLDQGLTMEAAIERIAFPDNPEKWNDGADDLAIAAE